jgi:hypothetical protein
VWIYPLFLDTWGNYVLDFSFLLGRINKNAPCTLDIRDQTAVSHSKKSLPYSIGEHL